MADITLYKPAAVTVQVIDGNPPLDQSAEVVALTAQLAAANALATARRQALDSIIATATAAP